MTIFYTGNVRRVPFVQYSPQDDPVKFLTQFEAIVDNVHGYSVSFSEHSELSLFGIIILIRLLFEG